MTIGERIRQARETAGLTQTQLAEKLNIPYQGISQWERNVRNPKMDSILRIANALSCDPYWLAYGEAFGIHDRAAQKVMRLFNTDDFHIQQAAKAAALQTDNLHAADGYCFSEAEKTLIGYFAALNEADRQRLIEYARQLTAR